MSATLEVTRTTSIYFNPLTSGYVIEIFENGAFLGLLHNEDGSPRSFKGRNGARKAASRWRRSVTK